MNNYKYKKLVIKFFVITVSLLILLKYSISIFKNEILNIVKSDRFDIFIVNILDQKIEKIANTDIPENKKKFYKENIEKILLKIEELN